MFVSYTIRVDRAAEKDIRKRDRKTQLQIWDALQLLAEDPYRQGVRQLAGSSNEFRYRVGDYRILYTVDGKRLVIQVMRVRHRSSIYK